MGTGERRDSRGRSVESSEWPPPIGKRLAGLGKGVANGEGEGEANGEGSGTEEKKKRTRSNVEE